MGAVVKRAAVGLPEALDQAGNGAALKLADRLHAVALEAPRRLWADAGDQPDALALEALGRLLAGEDDEAARLLGVGGDLGDELVRPDSDRGVEARLFADPSDQIAHLRDRVRHLGEVEVGLVERHRLDRHTDLLDQFADLGRALAVMRVVNRQPVRVGAEPPRPRRGHRRADPELPRLVRGGRDDRSRAGARHDHGLADQLRMALQLDGRIERIHVEMSDLPSHDRRRQTRHVISGRSGLRRARGCPRP